MDRNSPYHKQVTLLVRILPFVAAENCFALKGGTAINLFVRNFPRLSVDIDLAYLPLEVRDEALTNIRASLQQIAEAINREPDLNAALQDNNPDEMRVIVQSSQAQIKIEVSPVARGTLYPAVELDIVESVENEFGFASIHVVSIADLYGGKICAALDRQHPRDLFDIKALLDNEGINRDIFNGFITYLLCHSRPISEIMAPYWKDITEPFNQEFQGMTLEPVSLDELNAVPEQLMNSLKMNFTQRDFDFLMSVKQGTPDWSLAPNENIQHLPAIRWKLQNIQCMPQHKHRLALGKLEQVMLGWL